MKKRKLNSKNPKYKDKSLLKGKCVVKSVKGNALIRNSSGNIVGETTVRGVWYEQCYTRPDKIYEGLMVKKVRIKQFAIPYPSFYNSPSTR